MDVKRTKTIYLLMLAACTVASGQSLTIITAGSPDSIVTCTMKDNGRVDKCTLATGHTLEEVMQSFMDQNKMSADSWKADIDAADKRTLRCLDIAERENKNLRQCARSLDDIGHMLQKESGK